MSAARARRTHVIGIDTGHLFDAVALLRWCASRQGIAVHAAAPGTPACAGVISKSWLLRALIGGIMPPLRPTPVGRVPNRAAFILILCTARGKQGSARASNAIAQKAEADRRSRRFAGFCLHCRRHWRHRIA